MRLAVSSPGPTPSCLSDSLWAGHIVFAVVLYQKCDCGSLGLVSCAWVVNEALNRKFRDENIVHTGGE